MAYNFASLQIGRALGIGKSTVNDFIAAQRNIGAEIVEGLQHLAEKRVNKPQARILIIDIETAPFLAYTFRRWRANIGQENAVS